MAKVIYENPLSSMEDIRDFIPLGDPVISFPEGALRLGGGEDGIWLWCPQSFPADVQIEWEFRPLSSEGFAEMFFATKARNGGNVLESGSAQADNGYPRYSTSDMNAFRISFYRRKESKDQLLHTCSLHKDYGYNQVACGADPIPTFVDSPVFYRLTLVKRKSRADFYINDLHILGYEDDGFTYGDILTGGYVGLGQLSPMEAEYRNLRVTWI